MVKTIRFICAFWMATIKIQIYFRAHLYTDYFLPQDYIRNYNIYIDILYIKLYMKLYNVSFSTSSLENKCMFQVSVVMYHFMFFRLLDSEVVV